MDGEEGRATLSLKESIEFESQLASRIRAGVCNQITSISNVRGPRVGRFREKKTWSVVTVSNILLLLLDPSKGFSSRQRGRGL